VTQRARPAHALPRLAGTDREHSDELQELVDAAAELIAAANPSHREPDKASNLARLLTMDEAAAIVGVHVETLRRAARSGALGAVKAGRNWRVTYSDLHAWLSVGRSQAASSSLLRQPAPTRRTRRRPMSEAFAELGIDC
jgi:excisionase family DNA binding protein